MSAPVTVWSVSPEYLKASQRLASLCALEDSIIAELKDIDAVFFARSKHRPSSSAAAHTAKDVVQAKPALKISDAVRSLLAEFAPAPPPPAPAETTKVVYHDPLFQRANELAVKLADVRAAISLLHPELQRLRTEASKALCATVEPTYRALAARWFKAATALAEAQLEVDAFMRWHSSAELGFLRPFSTDLDRMGDPLDKQGGWYRMFAAGAEGGWWNLSDLPTALLQPATPHPTAPLPAPQPAKAR